MHAACQNARDMSIPRMFTTAALHALFLNALACNNQLTIDQPQELPHKIAQNGIPYIYQMVTRMHQMLQADEPSQE